ncbi:hypothetical protein V5P93_002090 [Actinokineospora auranticolor]|uniref:Uncharacterized protein n=1 Tax=Actinokineospora auranticolor TaxID=155976 RepID=A0A2S6GDV7_9PSEU|nr:hypothetical protein [Actinokineospora auranticolor]PPK63266.1 hypothetical protein CLV40_13058 [Actinokineospora auranticolor]
MDPRTDSRVAELLATAHRAVAAEAPMGAETVVVRVMGNALAFNYQLKVVDGWGGDGGAMYMPAEAAAAVKELRRVMYQPGRGTWCSIEVVFHRGGKEPEVSVNYDENPGWKPELHPTSFSRDQELFPRADEHIPAWLRELIDEGAELERQHFAESAGDEQR